MHALTIRGPYNGISGHDHHVRAFAHELSNQGVLIRLVDFADWSPDKLPGHLRDPWFDTLSAPLHSRAVLHFCMPHQVEAAPGMFNVNFTMFEASRIPAKWVKLNRQHDLVVLPTESSRRAWIESGFPEARVRLCPLGVDTDLFHFDGESLPLLDDQGRKVRDYAVRFLNVSDVTPRKNLLGLLRAWIRATRPTDDAILVLKLNCRSDGALKTFLRGVEEMEAEIGRSRRQSASILFMMNRLFADGDMPKLYRAATHYWSMSHGEGWDQPTMEAAAAGLHPIVPDHTAYATNLDGTVAAMIPARRVPARFRLPDGTHKLFRGADWWEPDEDVAATYIRHAIDHPPDGPNHGLRTRIVQNYTWQLATRRLVDILSELDSAEESTRVHRKRFRFLKGPRLWP